MSIVYYFDSLYCNHAYAEKLFLPLRNYWMDLELSGNSRNVAYRCF